MNLEINVKTKTGSLKISGTKHGPFLVHEQPMNAMVGMTDYSTWRVTHVDSGARFPWEFMTKESAVAFAADVAPVMDWGAARISQYKTTDKTKWDSGAPSKEQQVQINILRLARGGVRA